MTLKEYYDNLPEPTSPKSEFVREAAYKCGVAEITVKGWVKEKFVPSDPNARAYLAQVTGIPENELFPLIPKKGPKFKNEQPRS